MTIEILAMIVGGQEPRTPTSHYTSDRGLREFEWMKKQTCNPIWHAMKYGSWIYHVLFLGQIRIKEVDQPKHQDIMTFGLSIV